ncbi:prolipoprotein diacylglyceryl transferase [Tenacibaculum finnmarkense]|uniref:Phosphatidylglycerol--prolipoprotein diacylglyceryl transferase n=1 Tax=Tenacibaculum finnmarkense genomovar finnmarkense TaxID=1458503 RepID=A0AAP1RF07_9FLAO|nr:prolipoprotein diacylglyceryl transferase [Tenacibaculum finnmarkense]MBE7652853.1 prolipoprotein diacylglyceryl transferase [Tenacibaculum finnmarkense genomovar finnmarkense]MBE7695101.1 prolipoprotein diacylglyceryl transferase [Tenacibaculum finnmarkense genomovar finnmarkense]MCD8402634.1 prolipoprotein diacylglyceryl transferase [Tenacibaculum finnmarkense genomovar finnmarkense]MCD8413631.1 prolipoprotein diacylglyceryl transferase [Tenacibaculum finnmarkense genomovar ulcerans]MCD84
MNFLSIVWDLDPEIIKIGSFGIRWYSLMFVAVFILGLHLMKKIFINDNIAAEKLDPLFMYVFVSMLVGMRLGDVFFYSWDYYQHHLLEIFLPMKEQEGASTLFGLIKGWKFTGFTGFASHGAAIGIPIALYFYAKKHLQKSWLFILDRVAVLVALAGFFIRLGNFFNSEIYGKPTGTSFGVIFKRAGETVACHPTQLYEAFSYLALFFALWHFYWKTDKKKQEGFLFGLFMVVLWSLRFFIEFLKKAQVDSREDWVLNSLNTGQVLSIPLVLIGVWLMFRKSK